MYNLILKKKKKKEIKYDKFKKRDLKKIDDFFEKIENSYKRKISFKLSDGFPHFNYIHVYAKSNFLKKNNFILYPHLDHFSFFCLMKIKDKYKISQNFDIGSMLCEKEYAKRAFDIDDFEFDYHNIFFSKEKAMEKSKELADLLILNKFKEIDERKLKIRSVSYDRPNLVHHFNRFFYKEHDSGIIYTGSSINIEEELVENLEDSLIETNLELYYKFFENISIKK